MPSFTDRSAESQDFDEFFGASKVVDESGQPKVLYHGTGKSFSRFKGIAWGSEGVDLACDYAMMRDEWHDGEAQIMPLYLRIEQPFNADYEMPKSGVTIGDMITAMMKQAKVYGVHPTDDQEDRLRALVDLLRECSFREESGPKYDRHNFWCEPHMLFGEDGEAAIMEIFQILGFDGITMMEGGERTWGALSPDQIISRFDERALPLQSWQVAEAAGHDARLQQLRETRIVDDAGRPMKVYRGTANAGDEMRLSGKHRQGHGQQMEGIYFSCYENTAQGYARTAANAEDPTRDDDGVVVAAYLDLRNPKIYDEMEPFQTADREKLEASGYDGAVRINDFGEMVEVVAFDPGQVIEISRMVNGQSQASRPAIEVSPEPRIEMALAM